MASAFDPMPADVQRQFAARYLAYLRDRDGIPDLTTRRCGVREAFFASIDAAPCRWEGAPPVDQAVFDRNHRAASPEPELDRAALWALATAKTNRAERFGVELSLDHPRRTVVADNPHAYIQIEEVYHTRILRDALATLGLQTEVSDPNPQTRLLVRAMVYLPETFANVAVLAGEIVGVTLFSLLLAEARRLFASQPAVLERIELLFGQILVDEVGHVHYLRSRMSPWQLAAARLLLPVVVASVLGDIPELVRLFGHDAILARALAADVDADAAGYADRLVVGAAASTTGPESMRSAS